MNKTKLGTNLANRRRELGLKQEEVANKIHVSSKTISKWERGVSSPDISFWEGLADVLKIDLYEFVGYGEEKENTPSNALKTALKEDKTKKYKRIAFILSIVLILSIIFISGYLFYRDYTTEIIGISRGEVIEINKEYLIFQKDAAYDDERERWYAPKIIINRSEIQRGFDVEKGKRLKIKYMYKKGEVIERGEETEIRPLQILEISNLE